MTSSGVFLEGILLKVSLKVNIERSKPCMVVHTHTSTGRKRHEDHEF
jgi:hypothetical protein